MSRASRILTLMADGRQYSNADLCQLTGLTLREIECSIYQLREAGRLSSAPVMHSITAEGLSALAAGRFHGIRAPKQVKQAAPQRSVAQAIASRPALQSVWGARA